MTRQHNAEIQELQQLLQTTRYRMGDQMAKFASTSAIPPQATASLHPSHHMLQEMHLHNERLSASMKALSPRRRGGGGGGGSNSSGGGGGGCAAEDFSAGPWSLPPPVTAPMSPFRRGGGQAPYGHSASSWTVYGSVFDAPAYVAAQQQQQQHQHLHQGHGAAMAANLAQQHMRRKRPPPAPPGYVHVSHPGDTYI
ncbi:unnamed protein product [Notodromas monacha]|uniref:Uncharacterized protein n=1 Tax=Notodromas monacha TaxID=399045 RepID=A0A7R9GAS5_9CRUS|nr:unnamed protein product [Notodromas monacha]CAG0914048.1 unnamed protein product [Notodromas monacha]